MLLFGGMTTTASAADDITVVVDADFTQFTQGSPAQPVDFPSYGTGSFSSYFSGWMTSKIAQAGGALMIKDGGYVRTKSMNMSANGGIIRVTSKVRMVDSYGGMVKISCGYSSANVKQLMFTDTAWHTVSVVIGGGGSSSNVRVEPVLSASGLLMQNLKVEQSAGFIQSPEAQQPLVADGTHFTARWRSVTGATAYQISVYSYNGTEKVYKLENYDVGKVLTYNVTGLDPAVNYYYTVRATNGTGFSEPSNEIRVVKVISSLATPANLSAALDGNTVKCKWDAVADAQFYRLMADRIFTCPKDTMVDMIAENFDKVTQGELDAVEFTFSSKLDQYTQIMGWSGEDLALAKGHMVLSPFSSTGWLSTPKLNLTGKTSDFQVKATLAAGAFGTYYDGESAEIAIVNGTGDTIQRKTLTLTKGFATYTENFTGGTADCRVVLLYSGDRKLFIDSMVVSQLKAKGQTVTEFFKELNSETLNASFDIVREKNVKYSIRVMAAAETVSMGEIAEIYSDPSEAVNVNAEPGRVCGIDTDANATVGVEGNAITLELPAATKVIVSDLTGRILYNNLLEAGSHSLSMECSGVVIVVAGNKAHKLILK